MPGSDTRERLFSTVRERSGSGLTPLAPDVRSAEAPRRVVPTEQIVLDVWRPILRTAVVTPDARLCDLGATSFELMLAHGELEYRLGRPLPLVWMFEHPTPAALAAHIDSDAAGDRDDSDPVTSLLVPIRTSGSSPPFFFTGLGAGELTHNLARRLGKSQPFYALLTYSVDERHVDHDTFVDVASRYILEIKKVQRTGPYLLGGFCGQGPMVYEMAQQLIQNGDHVAMLAIFDGPAPGSSSALSRIHQTLYWIARKVQFHAAELCHLEPHHRPAYLRARMRNLCGRLDATRNGRRPRAVRPDSLVDAPQLDRRPNQRVLRYQLTMKYTPRRYPGRIVLFVGDDARSSHDSTFGWNTLAEGGVDVHEVSGIHTRMLAPPHDVSLARILAGAIQSALETAPRESRTS